MAQENRTTSIIGLTVAGPDEPRIKEIFDQHARLCDTAVIVGNNADYSALAKEYGFTFYRDDREWGRHQPSIKTDALAKIREMGADWVVANDADEIFDRRLTREGLDELAKTGVGYYFFVVNLIDDEEHWAWGFWNIRFFKLVPELGLQYLKKPVHCGLAPPYAYKYGNYAPYILKHYGLMSKESRKKKVERYKKYDPNAQYKDRSYYDFLKESINKKVGKPFDEERLHKRVAEEVRTYKMKDPDPNAFGPEPEGFVYMKKDGRTIDVPAKDQRRYERQGWEVVREVDIADDTSEEKREGHVCVICGFEARTAGGLKVHKNAKH